MRYDAAAMPTALADPPARPPTKRPKRRPASEPAAPPAPEADESRRLPLTVDLFMTLVDAGKVTGRVELVDGEMIEMASQGNGHRVGIGRMNVNLGKGWAPPKFISIQATHRFTEHDAPEPDLALLEAEPIPGALIDELPRLVIEVSDTSLAEDLGRKKADYARFGAPEYWVLDIAGQRLLVFRDPDAENQTWRSERVLGPDDAVSPLCIPDLSSRVGDLLPAASSAVG